MDLDRAKKYQSLKIIISELVMVIAVVITVIILAFLVSGYWLNSDFEVERQGMLQISSVPTGADVYIDGESTWLQRTNTSKVLSSGEHTILLTKDGYDTWSKTINISEGLLYRIHYPRLFLTERSKSKIYDAVGARQVFLSDNSETMLLYSGEAEITDTAVFAEPSNLNSQNSTEPLPEWAILDLGADVPEVKTVTYRTLYDFFKKSEVKNTNSIKDFNSELALSGSEELVFSKFYDDNYLTITDGASVMVYQKDISEPILEATLSFTPDVVTAGHNGEFTVFSAGAQVATLDMETMLVREWAVDGETFGWLDSDMLYSVKDGSLYVYDFDGLNRRILSSNVSACLPVTITKNKWLYYFSDDTLMRELITS